MFHLQVSLCRYSREHCRLKVHGILGGLRKLCGQSTSVRKNPIKFEELFNMTIHVSASFQVGLKEDALQFQIRFTWATHRGTTLRQLINNSWQTIYAATWNTSIRYSSVKIRKRCRKKRSHIQLVMGMASIRTKLRTSRHVRRWSSSYTYS